MKTDNSTSGGYDHDEAAVAGASDDMLKRGLEASGDQDGSATPPVAPKSDRPTQADLEKIVDAKTAAEAEAKWDDPDELAINALIHRAFAMEVERKGWSIAEIGSIHIKALRMAQAAIRLIPRREPIA